MQKNHFLLLKKVKNTESAHLCARTNARNVGDVGCSRVKVVNVWFVLYMYFTFQFDITGEQFKGNINILFMTQETGMTQNSKIKRGVGCGLVKVADHILHSSRNFPNNNKGGPGGEVTTRKWRPAIRIGSLTRQNPKRAGRRLWFSAGSRGSRVATNNWTRTNTHTPRTHTHTHTQAQTPSHTHTPHTHTHTHTHTQRGQTEGRVSMDNSWPP